MLRIEGIVEDGKHLGRRLGFPTANIAPRTLSEPWPANGVYVAALWAEGDPLAWPGMLNQGLHPTAPEGKPTVEIHLPGFSGSLYGRRVRVEYLRFLRPEKRFDGLEALVAQLERDRRETLQWLARRDEASDAALRRAAAIAWHAPGAPSADSP